MADLLTATDIAELRRDEWVSDLWNPHVEWGTEGSAKLTANASAGADTLALTGLGTGTITRGTNFTILSGGITLPRTVSADVAIVAGAATVSLTSRLPFGVLANDKVYVQPDRLGAFARVFGGHENRPQFSDVQIEDFAKRATGMWAAEIHKSSSPRPALFAAISILAIDAKLASTEHALAVEQMGFQDGGTAFRAQLEKRKGVHLKALGLDADSQAPTGPTYGVTTR